MILVIFVPSRPPSARVCSSWPRRWWRAWASVEALWISSLGSWTSPVEAGRISEIPGSRHTAGPERHRFLWTLAIFVSPPKCLSSGHFARDFRKNVAQWATKWWFDSLGAAPPPQRARRHWSRYCIEIWDSPNRTKHIWEHLWTTFFYKLCEHFPGKCWSRCWRSHPERCSLQFSWWAIEPLHLPPTPVRW